MPATTRSRSRRQALQTYETKRENNCLVLLPLKQQPQQHGEKENVGLLQNHADKDKGNRGLLKQRQDVYAKSGDMGFGRKSSVERFREKTQSSWSHSNFEILEQLGSGAQSRVVRGREKATNKDYAIKIIDYNVNKKYADRELEIHKSLEFPGIVELHGHYFVSDPPNNDLCLILEYCPKTMLDVMRTKPDKRIPESEAALYMAEMTKTLQNLHARNIMHRDIKLSNILVSAHGSTKLADFGISKSIRDPRLRKTIIGTEGYMAPEIENNTAATEEAERYLRKFKEGGDNSGACCDTPVHVDLYDSQYDEKIDLWSLGATLHAMVTGNLPCEDRETEYNSDFDFCFDSSPDFDFEFPEHLSTDAMDLILGLLEEDPSARISLQDVLSHPWILKSV